MVGLPAKRLPRRVRSWHDLSILHHFMKLLRFQIGRVQSITKRRVIDEDVLELLLDVGQFILFHLLFSFFKLLFNIRPIFNWLRILGVLLLLRFFFWHIWFSHQHLFIWKLLIHIKILGGWRILCVVFWRLMLSLIYWSIVVGRNRVHLHYLVNKFVLHRVVSWLLWLLATKSCCGVLRPAYHIEWSDLSCILMNKSAGANRGHLRTSRQKVDTHAFLLIWGQVGVERILSSLLQLRFFLLLFICSTKCAWEVHLSAWSLLWIILVTIHIGLFGNWI